MARESVGRIWLSSLATEAGTTATAIVGRMRSIGRYESIVVLFVCNQLDGSACNRVRVSEELDIPSRKLHHGDNGVQEGELSLRAQPVLSQRAIRGCKTSEHSHSSCEQQSRHGARQLRERGSRRARTGTLTPINVRLLSAAASRTMTQIAGAVELTKSAID